MLKVLLLLLTLMVAMTCHQETKGSNYFLPLAKQLRAMPATIRSHNEIEIMLYKEIGLLNVGIINKTTTALRCAQKHNVEHNNILTVINYSLPSSEKRLWVFDLAENKLLFHTYVSHGIKSGTLLSKYFSNRMNSKATSMGVYSTEKAYRGRHGLSLKLHGLDRYFNNNAYRRFIVMHGSWYVNKKFIEKYGRAGRSWGCPAIPLSLVKPIINTIKDKSLFVAYYPGNGWFSRSKFLNCDKLPKKNKESHKINIKVPKKEFELRGKVLFADTNNNNKREESEPVVTVTADSYQRLFKTNAPLKRMLRRQINNTEYIVLNIDEIERMAADKTTKENNKKKSLNIVYFIIPNVKMQRGYYATEMKIINSGKVKEVKLSATKSEKGKQINHHTIYLEGKPSVKLRSTGRFIRWLGL